MSNGQAMEKSEKAPSAQLQLKHALERIQPALAEVLPKHVTAERIVKVVLSATARNPKLLRCSQASIIRCVMQAGELGLEIGGLLGDGYLVPFYNKDTKQEEAQFIPGYRGLLRLARNSGVIQSISAHVVYDDDKFELDLAEESMKHHPNLKAGERRDGSIFCVYAVARFKDGGKQTEFMTRPQVDAIRNRSKASNSGPWVTDYAEMARKTVVRRLCKYLPLSPELARALEIDAENEQDEAKDAVVVDMATAAVMDAAQSRSKRLTSKVKANVEQQEQPREEESAETPKSEPKSEPKAAKATKAAKPVEHDADGRVPDGEDADYQSDADEGPPPDEAG